MTKYKIGDFETMTPQCKFKIGEKVIYGSQHCKAAKPFYGRSAIISKILDTGNGEYDLIVEGLDNIKPGFDTFLTWSWDFFRKPINCPDYLKEQTYG